MFPEPAEAQARHDEVATNRADRLSSFLGALAVEFALQLMLLAIEHLHVFHDGTFLPLQGSGTFRICCSLASASATRSPATIHFLPDLIRLGGALLNNQREVLQLLLHLGGSPLNGLRQAAQLISAPETDSRSLDSSDCRSPVSRVMTWICSWREPWRDLALSRSALQPDQFVAFAAHFGAERFQPGEVECAEPLAFV